MWVSVWASAFAPLMHSTSAVPYSYVRYAKTYLYPHNSVCGLPYEKENRNGITIAFVSLSSLSLCLFGFWFTFCSHLSSPISHLIHCILLATKCVCVATNVSWKLCKCNKSLVAGIFQFFRFWKLKWIKYLREIHKTLLTPAAKRERVQRLVNTL